MWPGYRSDGCFDEMIDGDGRPRPECANLVDMLGRLDDLTQRQEDAELAIKTMGISFTVYSEGENIDRAWPFDIIPRVISTTPKMASIGLMTVRQTANMVWLQTVQKPSAATPVMRPSDTNRKPSHPKK